MIPIAIVILAAYFIGAIPFGLIVGLAKGIDPRKSGSGNIGATNLGRLLGGRYFALVFCLDMLKGLVPVVAMGVLLRHDGTLTQTDYVCWLLAGFAAIFGHMFSPFLHFKGGKGVATSCGVLLGIYPFFTFPGLLAIGVWIVLFKVTRYVSVASIFGSLSFPVLYTIFAVAMGWHPFTVQLPLLIFGTLMALMIVYKHRGNIARLRAGTENRFGPGPS